MSDGLPYGAATAAIWIRLPQVSSSTAVVTPGPISAGSWVKRTPAALSRSYSARTSSTANEVNGMPSATSASLNGLAAGCSSGSSSSSGPSGPSGETTVSQRCSPSWVAVMAVLLSSSTHPTEGTSSP